jgi:hypothetical protein
MTPELASRKMAEIEAMIDSLEPHATRHEVAMARQSLRGAAYWMHRLRENLLEIA